MNTPTKPSPNGAASRPRQQGVALVITLLCLVLLVVLAVGFLGNVATNRTASATEHGIALTQSLSESVVELVKAQITEGTRSQTSSGADLGWASQPGMIRTFEVGGTPGTYYKLYSATEMVTAGTAYSVNDDVPADAGNQAVWADLNRPVLNSDGTTLSYPIVNPDAEGEVEGFTCNATAAWGYAGGAASPTNNPAPMPVRWLYVLQNGSMVPAVASGNGSATVAGATTDNPIIGRVAFWTDDDTCKVNLNTASEGIFWDVPRANTATERDFSSFQPVQNEFQRYPGHPAMTSLSSVFGYWLPLSGTLSSDYPMLSNYYALTPRVSGGGSAQQLSIRDFDSARAAITLDPDRLYTSTDEFLFSALGAAPSTATPRTTNDTALTRQVIETTRFFTTTDSRAPDVNLFGQPRITIWPLRPLPYDTSPTGKWTPQEQLIDFCSTIGGRRYAFTRNDARSRTNDYASQPRNRDLFSYLKDVTSRPIPGFPNQSFEDKYTADERDQILTEIFDYIRCTAPLYGVANLAYGDKNGFGGITPISISGKKGFGMFKTINEVDLLFYAYDVPAHKEGEIDIPLKRYMQAVILPHLYFPHVGFTDWTALTLNISATANMTITPSAGGAPVTLTMPSATAFMYGRAWLWNAGFAGAGYGLAPWFETNGGVAKSFKRGDPNNGYPFYTDPVEIPADSTGNFTFSGVDLTIDLLESGGPTATPMQRFSISFPTEANIPYPKPASDSPVSAPGLSSNATFADRYTGFDPATPTVPKLKDTPFYYPGDVVRAAVIDPNGTTRGDVRMVAGLAVVPANYFTNILVDGPVTNIRTNIRNTRSEFFVIKEGGQLDLGINKSGNLVIDVSSYKEPPNAGVSSQPYVPPGLNGALLKDANGNDAPGDWSTSMAHLPDSASIDLADYFSGSGAGHFDSQGAGSMAIMPVFFAPNRTMPSPIVFGSLPTGVLSGNPWQTMLFCPNSAATMSGNATNPVKHPGSVAPPDHLLLDLFKMPVVEPYAISDPFSTAGKINLNYRLAPFNHITRKTGIYALLKSARVYAVPDGDVNIYKYPGRYGLYGPNANIIDKPNFRPMSTNEYRLKIDPAETTAAFDAKFADGDIFRSASQLCEMFLYPEGTSYNASGSNIKSFWSDKRLTGDNMRESPYRDLYGRVTTQSNTYTVHYIVQALKKVPGGAANVWTEGTDKVIGEYRGSTSIERYIDPEDTRLKTSPPDFATAPTSTPSAANRMDSYYRIRTLGTRRFNP